MKSTGKIMTAFSVGIAAGAVLSLLTMKDKDIKTRRKISHQCDRMSDQLKRISSLVADNGVPAEANAVES